MKTYNIKATRLFRGETFTVKYEVPARSADEAIRKIKLSRYLESVKYINSKLDLKQTYTEIN